MERTLQGLQPLASRQPLSLLQRPAAARASSASRQRLFCRAAVRPEQEPSQAEPAESSAAADAPVGLPKPPQQAQEHARSPPLLQLRTALLGTVAAASTAAALLHPGPAEAAVAAVLLQSGAVRAEQLAEAVQDTYLLLFVGVGATVLTAVAAGRFALSFFPDLEKEAQQRALPWAMFTVCDPVLAPLQKGLFRMEPGDLNYGAVVLLAVLTAVLECLVGDGGLLQADRLPCNAILLNYMKSLLVCQNCLLLPSWVLVMLRSFWLI